MTINKKVDGNKMTLSLEDRLDTTTAPQLENELKVSLYEIKELTLDLEKLEYLSSAGLRVLLTAQKQMENQGGEMVVKNANETIMEVFEVTGFVDIITIK